MFRFLTHNKTFSKSPSRTTIPTFSSTISGTAFPPYYHPTGAHLSDVVNMPWVHLFFTEKMLVKAYKELVRGLPDEKERCELRISRDENGNEYFGYINKMTLKRFKAILKKLAISPVYYREVPLRSYFKLFAKMPLLKEMFVKMAVCVIEK